jgi:uncharacterized protein (DUF983 family)
MDLYDAKRIGFIILIIIIIIVILGTGIYLSYTVYPLLWIPFAIVDIIFAGISLTYYSNNY